MPARSLDSVTPAWLYALTFIGATALSLLLVPTVREYAQRKQITDQPGGHKSHVAPVPYLGGVAMVLAFSAAMFVGVVVRRSSQFDGREIRLTIGNLFAQGDGLVRELIVVLGLALIFAAMGLIDDLRGLSPWLRFAVGLGIAVTLVAYGIRLQSPLPDIADVVISVVWILGITNAFNLLDNIDGLAAGTAAVASATFFLIALFNNQEYSALLAIGLAGAMLGFLRSNFHPASIYMGDAGSLFIGFMMAYLGLKMRTAVTEIPQLFAPLVVLGVAVLDTTMVVVSRIKRGVSPFEGGKDHLSHRLMRLGVSVRRGVTIILFGGATCGLIGVALYNIRGQAGYWVVAAVLTIAGASTVLLTTKRALLTVVADTDRSVA